MMVSSGRWFLCEKNIVLKVTIFWQNNVIICPSFSHQYCGGIFSIFITDCIPFRKENKHLKKVHSHVCWRTFRYQFPVLLKDWLPPKPNLIMALKNLYEIFIAFRMKTKYSSQYFKCVAPTCGHLSATSAPLLFPLETTSIPNLP